ncbi:MAG: energy transducer TonB [Rhodobacteraceae bacterium]|jgi:protein TonB|nr:energy transducer TonB [Paracoccaceae bacterium]MCZ8084562.1 energy transducer TonB [Paracoccaceae bacterium]
MTGARLQAAAALILALGLHLGAFALRPGPAGASGSGAGGADMISLQAAGPSVSDMVAAWDSPPDTPALSELAVPATPEMAPHALPETALNDVAPALPSLTPPPLAPALPDALPQADTAPAPPPPPAVKPRPRPAPPAPTAPVAEPRPEQPAPSDSSAAQVAAGTGAGALAGEGGQAQAPSLSQGRINDLTANWGAKIRARIEKRKRYPLAADGASGTVTVRLTVTRSGALAGLSIAASSGNPALDEAAIKAVRAAGRFPAAPEGLSQDSISFTLPMRFSR